MGDEKDISSMEESKCTTIHGVIVGAVSPVKVSRSTGIPYFETKMTDGKKTARVVSFEPKLRNEIEEAGKARRGVAISRCTVKRARFGGSNELEIVADSKSAVVSSPKKFRLSDDTAEASVSDPETATYVVVDDLPRLCEQQRVNLLGKALSISPPQELTGKNGTKYLKQEFTIADSTAVCRGVAWQQHVNVVKEGQSYKFVGITVRSFDGQKYLSLGEMCTVTKIEDIGAVVDDEAIGERRRRVLKGDIAVVIGMQSYASCRNCNSKICDVTKAMVQCEKCNAKMKSERCAKKSIARIILEDGDGNEHQLTMFNDVFEEIARHGREATESDEVEEQILSAPRLQYTISSKDVITSVCTIWLG